jgi:hypothetical protein
MSGDHGLGNSQPLCDGQGGDVPLVPDDDIQGAHFAGADGKISLQLPVLPGEFGEGDICPYIFIHRFARHLPSEGVLSDLEDHGFRGMA